MAQQDLQRLRSGHFSDALDELNLPGGRAPVPVYLGAPGATAMGPAYTLRQLVVTHEPKPGVKPVTRHADAARELAAPGEVLVIDVGGEQRIGTWGEAQTMRAMARGLAGVLVHGASRDGNGLRERGLPVGCVGMTPVRSSGRLETVAMGEPVNFAGMVIRAGDLVVFDEDGVVCVPAEHASAVTAEAKRIAAREADRDRQLQAALVRP